MKDVEVETVALSLKNGFRAIILEADEWRPLAQHVLDLIELAVQELKKENDKLKRERDYSRRKYGELSIVSRRRR